MKLLLIDGHALAYRSYYAMIRSPLTNSRGENTSAEFGFVRAVLALIKERSPDAFLSASIRWARAFATSVMRPTGHPGQDPAELHASVERIQEFLHAAGFAWIRREGYEADDLLASAARQSAAAGWEVLLLSGDKDLCSSWTRRSASCGRRGRQAGARAGSRGRRGGVRRASRAHRRLPEPDGGQLRQPAGRTRPGAQDRPQAARRVREPGGNLGASFGGQPGRRSRQAGRRSRERAAHPGAGLPGPGSGSRAGA